MAALRQNFRGLSHLLRTQQRMFNAAARQPDASAVVNKDRPDPTVPAPVDADKKAQLTQAPNRVGVWAPSQQPREKAMTGPRFEQTSFDLQPQPWSAMELVHKQPVRWTHDRIVSCDGGGGPAGHPRVFINVDKPEICVCNYCGLPFANEHHRDHLEALPQTSYPLA